MDEDTDDGAVSDLTVLDDHLVIWLSTSEDRSRSKLRKGTITYVHIRLYRNNRGVMISLIARERAIIQIEQCVRHTYDCAHFGLHVLGQRLQSDLTRLHDDTTRVHEEYTVAMRVYLELGDALFGRLDAVLGFVGRVLDEAVQDVHS